MKKAIDVAFLVSAMYFLSGCTHWEKIADSIYEPITVTNTLDTAQGPVSMVTTNGWVVSPNVKSGVNLAGDLAPTPYGGLIANAVLGALGILAHVRSKKWKNATLSAVSAAQDFKRELSGLDSKVAQATKQKVRTDQKIKGTQTEIQKALDILG
jgi:hypothetical protein